jgi:hypothetical protein
MKLRCPVCHAPIEGAAVNVTKDVAFCAACQQAWACSDLLRRDEAASLNLIDPPGGIEFERRPNGFSLSATTRSAAAFIMVPFVMVWSGGSLGGIYGSQIAKGQFDPGMSLFGLPFLIGSVMLVTATLMAIAGRVRLRVEGDRGEVHVGVAGIGQTRRFSWPLVRRVETARSSIRYPGGQSHRIQLVLQDGREILFGSGLSAERRGFLERAIEKLLLERELPESLEPGTLSLPAGSEDEGRLSVVNEQGALSKTRGSGR